MISLNTCKDKTDWVKRKMNKSITWENFEKLKKLNPTKALG